MQKSFLPVKNSTRLITCEESFGKDWHSQGLRFIGSKYLVVSYESYLTRIGENLRLFTFLIHVLVRVLTIH